MRKIQNFFSYFRASELPTNQIFELFDSSNKGKDISPYYDTYIFLHNKLGNRYPSYTDSRSKKSVTVPESAVWPVVAAANRDSWTTSQRTQYRTWYEKTYNNGNSMDWTDIQIHHIKPLKYGGKSVNSNLIPLPKATHTQFTTWWAQY